jgi:hypothetical protein
MHSTLVQYLFLILRILAFNLVADKLRLAYPILLVLAGLVGTQFLIPKYLSLIDMEVKLREEPLTHGER